jgi:DnaK suppressor protein
MMLSAEKIDMYRKRLEEERLKLLAQIKETEKPEDFGGDVDDFDEERDEATDFSNQVAISQSLKNRVNEIDGALNRMEMGTYGLCEQCNRPISEEMLKTVPETKLCENCKRAA